MPGGELGLLVDVVLLPIMLDIPDSAILVREDILDNTQPLVSSVSVGVFTMPLLQDLQHWEVHFYPYLPPLVHHGLANQEPQL